MLVKLDKAQTGQAGNHRRSRIRIPPRGTVFSRFHKVVSEVGWTGEGGCIADHVRDSEGKTPMYVTKKKGKSEGVGGTQSNNEKEKCVC